MDRLQRSHHPTTDSVLQRVSRVLRNIQRKGECGTLDHASAKRELTDLLTNLSRLEGNNSLPEDQLKQAIRSVAAVKDNLPVFQEESSEPNRYDQTIPNPHGKGRNLVDIDMEKFQQLIQLGFTVKKIAEDGLLGGVVHPNTLYKRLKDHDAQIRKSYSNISDEDLVVKVADYNKEHPNSGALEVQAYLKTQGLVVQRDRCRAVLARVDGTGTAMRWSCTIQRREYKVPTANFIWHLDTHHSLDRWGIVVHGGIDGFSRLITFLRASPFNSSKAAACFFLGGIKKYGVPSRVRVDHGTEYVDVGRLMNAVNGEERGSFITGPSVHNQRIERLWRDVFCKVIDRFYKLFCYMEERQVLCMDNDIHKWALQYVFVGRINDSCIEWMETHNHHKVRTENNKTPSMMWFQSLYEGDAQKYTAVRNIEEPPTAKVETAVQNLNLQVDDSSFLLSRFPCPLSPEDLTTLQASVDIRRPSDSHGLDIFGEVVQFVTERTL